MMPLPSLTSSGHGVIGEVEPPKRRMESTVVGLTAAGSRTCKGVNFPKPSEHGNRFLPIVTAMTISVGSSRLIGTHGAVAKAAYDLVYVTTTHEVKRDRLYANY